MTRTVSITVPETDWSFLMDLAKVRSWTTSEKRTRKSGLDKAIEDFNAGNIYYASDGADLIKQCLS